MKKPSKPSMTSRPRWLTWIFRLVSVVMAPLLLLGALELGLRIFDVGHRSGFLLKSSNAGQPTFIQNNQFGWRFFGKTLARLPNPFSITREKRAKTIRIFVFGESAAYGDPQPDFGLSRMLKVMLAVRHPGVKFEVINAAMTGINSHTILPIAGDCARAQGDIWVIYMGNNEVVGPFGSGTVFGPQTPPLPIIRASLALKATRTGQMLDTLGRIRQPQSASGEWGGMMMFLHQQVRADDPRMARVYDNFQKNLEDILQAGRNAGVGVVLGTVGVNLVDCAPFGSLHRVDLSAAEKSVWDAAYDAGIKNLDAGQMAAALENFKAAEKIDPDYADLRFNEGRCALALGDDALAQNQFMAARDNDTLRFRCDERLNGIIREVATRQKNGRIILADVEEALAAQSPHHLPGSQFFYEHVHPTFAGNYLIARTLADEVEKMLPTKVVSTIQPWPDQQTCAQRLGWTERDLRAALSEILSRITDPPFTLQSNHRAQQEHLYQVDRGLTVSSQTNLSSVLATVEQAIALTPDDAPLYQKVSGLKQQIGDLPGAEAAVRRAVELLPSSLEAWTQLGLMLVKQQKYEDAIAAFRRASALDSLDVWSLQNIAVALGKLNRHDEAIREFRHALAIKPKFGLASMGLGLELERTGDQKGAQECFQQALTNRIHRADELTTLARFCQSRGWIEAAATNFLDAIQLSPADASLWFDAGQLLATLGRHDEASRQFAEAAELSPGWGQAHFMDGLELGRINQPAAAEREFRETIRLMPTLAEAHLNLAIALTTEKKYDEAVEEFKTVLRAEPNNPVALKYLQRFKEN